MHSREKRVSLSPAPSGGEPSDLPRGFVCSAPRIGIPAFYAVQAVKHELARSTSNREAPGNLRERLRSNEAARRWRPPITANIPMPRSFAPLMTIDARQTADLFQTFATVRDTWSSCLPSRA